jgi:ketosteroid isomerase-like protein
VIDIYQWRVRVRSLTQPQSFLKVYLSEGGGTLRAMTTSDEVVREFWTRAEARDWAGFGELLADDVVYELPQSRERIHGKADYLQFNEEYPGDWHATLLRAVGQGSHAATWISMKADGDVQPALTFFELDEQGLIARITEFWPEPYEPPPGREHLVERL